MNWKFWKRNSVDPLARVLFNNYRLNLLTIPREKASVGDLYVRDKDNPHLSTPGTLVNFLEPRLDLPPIISDDSMADQVSNVASDNVSANEGIQFLENFLRVLLGGTVAAKIGANLRAKKTQTLKFQFGSLSRDSLDVAELGNRLRGHRIREDNALFARDRRYYLVCGVARCQAISVIAQDDSSQEVQLDVEIASLVSSTGGGSVQRSGSKQITFKNDSKRLAFGVELYELRYDNTEQRFILDTVTDGFTVRGPGGTSFVGADDSMFFDLN